MTLDTRFGLDSIHSQGRTKSIGHEGADAITVELRQLHNRKVMTPVDKTLLSREELCQGCADG
jgi:hypothetical protein